MAGIMAGYVRVSTEMQADKDSIINQQESIAAFAKAKGREVRIYKDVGISAKDQARPAFQTLLDDIATGAVDTIVVTKLDRITRSLKDLIFLKDYFEQHNVSFIALTQNLDTSTPMGCFSFYVLGLVAQLEREVTAERVAEVMRSRAHKKKWNGGVIPYGFTSQQRVYKEWFRDYARERTEADNKGKKKIKQLLEALENKAELRVQAQSFAESRVPDPQALVIDEAEAEVVRHIFELYISCKSFRGVTHRLNATGYRTRNGVTWASTSIRRILQNPAYIGTLTYNKRRVKGKTSSPRPVDEHILVEDVFESIVGKEIFDEVQEIIAQQKSIAPRAKSSAYLLTGIVKCGLCDSRMYGYTQDDNRRKPGRIYQYYRCNGHLHKGNEVCTGNTIDLKYLEKVLISELRQFKLHPEKLRDKVEAHNAGFDQHLQPLQKQQNELKTSIQGIEKKVARLFSLYEDELIQKDEFSQRKTLLDQQRRELENQLDDVSQKIMAQDISSIDLESTLSQLNTLADVYDALDFADRKELLRTVLSCVVVGEKWIDYSIYAYNRFFVNYDCTGRGSSPMPA